MVFFNHKNLLFYLKKSNFSTISLCFLSSRRAEEPANFLVAPAPYFFPSGSGAGSRYFFKRLRLQGAKKTRLRLPSPAIIFFGKSFFEIKTYN